MNFVTILENSFNDTIISNILNFFSTTSFKYLNWLVMAELPIVYRSSKTCQNESDFSQSFDPSNRN